MASWSPRECLSFACFLGGVIALELFLFYVYCLVFSKIALNSADIRLGYIDIIPWICYVSVAFVSNTFHK